MKIIFAKIFLLSIISVLFLGVHYSDFNIVSDADNVVISWHTTIEGSLSEIAIERKMVNSIFTEIDILKAKGDNSSYTYTDTNAFKIEEGVYVYRLKFKNSDGTFSYSSEQTITHLTSVSKKTWGSIKALFR